MKYNEWCSVRRQQGELSCAGSGLTSIKPRQWPNHMWHNVVSKPVFTDVFRQY